MVKDDQFIDFFGGELIFVANPLHFKHFELMIFPSFFSKDEIWNRSFGLTFYPMILHDPKASASHQGTLLDGRA